MNFIKPLLRLWTPLLPMTLETLFYTVYKISVLYSKEKCYITPFWGLTSNKPLSQGVALGFIDYTPSGLKPGTK